MSFSENPRADECKIVDFRVPEPGEYFLATHDDHLTSSSARGPGWVYHAVRASVAVAKGEPRYIVERIEPQTVGTCEVKVVVNTAEAEERLRAFTDEVEERFKAAYEGSAPPPCCVHFDEEPIADESRVEFISSVLSTPPAPPADNSTTIIINIDPRTPANTVRELGFALEAIA